jgi:hypothetical protein
LAVRQNSNPIPVKNLLDKDGCASSIISAIISVTHCYIEGLVFKRDLEPAQDLMYTVNEAINVGFKVVDRLKKFNDDRHKDIRLSFEEWISVIGQITEKETLIPTITPKCYEDIFQDDHLEKTLDLIINHNHGSMSKFFHVC